jgi:glycosyltransferase involved in cell wall biosynthesis
MSIELPLVSIVAICYNQASYAVETLDSIIAQTYPHIQLIIIDDCSTDNSVEVIQNWIDENNVDCEFVIHSENLGVTKTCNDGLRMVKGKYYQLIACDDILNPNKIEKQVQLLEENNHVAMVYSDVFLIDQDSNVTDDSLLKMTSYFPNLPTGDIFSELAKDNFIPAPSVLIKSLVPDNIGFYDESLLYEDYDMFLRISRSYDILYIKENLAKYRTIPNQLSQVTKQNGIKELVRTKARLKHIGIKDEWDKTILIEIVRSVDGAMLIDRELTLEILKITLLYFKNCWLKLRFMALKLGLPSILVAKIFFKLRKFDSLYG